MLAGVPDKNVSSQTLSLGRVKNATPEFLPPENKKTLPFNIKLMKAIKGFTSRFDFSMLVAFARSNGKCQRMPRKCRRDALEALFQGICFHFDPLANRVNVTMTTLAIECGLATESAQGNLSITRATRALQSLARLGLITYSTEFNATLGCNNPTDIMLTSEFFDAINVSSESVQSARESRAAWKNKQRAKQGLPKLPLHELISLAWKSFRDRFHAYHLSRKKHGEERARARRESTLTRSEIEDLVKRELTREIAQGLFPASREAVLAEIARRVKRRMMLSRDNYTRLAAA